MCEPGLPCLLQNMERRFHFPLFLCLLDLEPEGRASLLFEDLHYVLENQGCLCMSINLLLAINSPWLVRWMLVAWPCKILFPLPGIFLDSLLGEIVKHDSCCGVSKGRFKPALLDARSLVHRCRCAKAPAMRAADIKILWLYLGQGGCLHTWV